MLYLLLTQCGQNRKYETVRSGSNLIPNERAVNPGRRRDEKVERMSI